MPFFRGTFCSKNGYKISQKLEEAYGTMGMHVETKTFGIIMRLNSKKCYESSIFKNYNLPFTFCDSAHFWTMKWNYGPYFSDSDTELCLHFFLKMASLYHFTPKDSPSRDLISSCRAQFQHVDGFKSSDKTDNHNCIVL